jgi:hypothetical protein
MSDKTLFFQTWNKGEIDIENEERSSIAEFIDQITGNHEFENTSGVFMYQEIKLQTLLALQNYHTDALRMTVEWHSMNDLREEVSRNINQNEIFDEYDYCFIYINGKICGHFVNQKSWSHSDSLNLYTLNNIDIDRLNGKKTKRYSYNGIIWCPDIFSFIGFSIPKYFFNQNNKNLNEKFGYRSSFLIELQMIENISVKFKVITIHGFVSLDKRIKFLQIINDELKSEQNLVLGGDFNMTKDELRHNKLFKTFYCYDDFTKNTNYNDKAVPLFQEKIDWIFFRLQCLSITTIKQHADDIDLVQTKKQKSDHIKIIIFISFITNKHTHTQLDLLPPPRATIQQSEQPQIIDEIQNRYDRGFEIGIYDNFHNIPQQFILHNASLQDIYYSYVIGYLHGYNNPNAMQKFHQQMIEQGQELEEKRIEDFEEGYQNGFNDFKDKNQNNFNFLKFFKSFDFLEGYKNGFDEASRIHPQHQYPPPYNPHQQYHTYPPPYNPHQQYHTYPPPYNPQYHPQQPHQQQLKKTHKALKAELGFEIGREMGYNDCMRNISPQWTKSDSKGQPKSWSQFRVEGYIQGYRECQLQLQLQSNRAYLKKYKKYEKKIKNLDKSK